MPKRKRVNRTLRKRAAAGSNRAARRLENRTGTPRSKFPQINKAGQKASNVLSTGSALGQQILPEVFAGGSGLDRTEFTPVVADQLDFAEIDQFLAPSVADAQAFRDDTAGRYDELLQLRRDKLGGLDAAENQALKESLFRDIDRGRATALRDVSRTPGLGAGSSFAQRRAIGRDFDRSARDANRQLLLDNVGIKRQALGDFEATVGGRQSAVGAATDRIAGLQGLRAQGRQSTGQFNIGNKMAADQFSSSGKFASDQFNAGQQGAELAGRVGAISAGTGLLGDERDAIRAKREREKLLAFLEERDAALAEQARGLFG